LKSDRILYVTSVFCFLAVIVGIPASQAGHEAVADRERPYLVNLYTALPSKPHWHGWDQGAKDKSFISKAIRPRIQQFEYDWLGYAGPKAVESKSDRGWLFYTPDVQYLIDAPWNDARFRHGGLDTLVAGRRLNLRDPIPAILDFRDRLQARGIRLLLVPVPGKPSIYPEKLDPGLTVPPASPTEGLLAEMRRRGLDAVDLFTPIKAAKTPDGPELYLRRDTHWSPAGLAVAADIVAKRIQDDGFGPRGDAPARYAYKATTVERWGDIGEMTQIPGRKAAWPSQTVSARQVIERSTLKPYADADSSDILLLGDSFARIYQTDAPQSAGLISQLALRLNRPLASIVNDGGASTLVRRQLYRKAALLQGKKLVVWEFVERDIRFGEGGWQILDLPDPAAVGVR